MPMTTLSPRQALENLGFPHAYWLACRDRKLAVCAIPKNGCTTIKQWFRSIVEPGSPDPADIHKLCAERWVISLWDGPSRDQAFEDFLTMAFVREPLARVASAFIEKFVGGHPYGCFEPAREVMEDIARLRGELVELDETRRLVFPEGELEVPASRAVNYERGITFRQFVEYLCRAPDSHLDVHWKPQCLFLWNFRIDLLGRVETLTDSLCEVAQRMSLPQPPPPKVLERDEIGNECLADTPSSELYQRFIYERARLPPAAALYDDDLRLLAGCRYALDTELYEQAATDRRSSLQGRCPSC